MDVSTHLGTTGSLRMIYSGRSQYVGGACAYNGLTAVIGNTDRRKPLKISSVLGLHINQSNPHMFNPNQFKLPSTCNNFLIGGSVCVFSG